MRILILSIIAIIEMYAYGQSTLLPISSRTITPAARSNLLARTGGHLLAASDGPIIRIINLQTKVPITALKETSINIQSLLRLPVSISAQSSDDPMGCTIQALLTTNTAVAIGIVDVPSYPSLLIAPENRWAMVNIAALNKGLNNNRMLIDRTNKELWRAFGYLMGAAHSNQENCLLKSVLTPCDLDILKSQTLSPEPFAKILQHAKQLGIKPLRRVTYRQAVEEGWAPMPTNSFQKVIWDTANPK